MTIEDKILDAKEFTSILLSCELAAEIHKSKPNKAIRNTLSKCKERVTSPRIKQVCAQGVSSPFPLGWLNRQLNNIVRIGDGKMTKEEFLAIGASL